jgi:ethanolamine utilization protein EutN
MLLGRVIGEVWATRKSPALGNHKMLLIQPRCAYGSSFGRNPLVALDDLDAGVGDEVVVCFGSPPRWRHGGSHVPVEAAVAAIVDRTVIHHEDDAVAFQFAEES